MLSPMQKIVSWLRAVRTADESRNYELVIRTIPGTPRTSIHLVLKHEIGESKFRVDEELYIQTGDEAFQTLVALVDMCIAEDEAAQFVREKRTAASRAEEA